MSPVLGIIASQMTGHLVTSSFESIATVTSTGSSNTLSFSSIPSTYKHLQVRFIGGDVGDNYIKMQFNSDTATNYSWHDLRGNGSAASAGATASTSQILFGATFGMYFGSSYVTAGIVDILDYANTNKYKTTRTLHGFDTNGSANGQGITLNSGLWQSTSAITTITFTTIGSVLTSGSTFALYGIKGA